MRTKVSGATLVADAARLSQVKALESAQGRSAEGVRRSLFCPSAGEGDHPDGHAVCGRMAGREPVCMETGERWCGTGIGSPRPRATSPSSPTSKVLPLRKVQAHRRAQRIDWQVGGAPDWRALFALANLGCSR